MYAYNLLYGFQKLRLLGPFFFFPFLFLYKDTIFQTITEFCMRCYILIILM